MTDLFASAVWIDANGRTRMTILKTLAGAAPITSAMQAFQLAALQQIWESAVVLPGTPAAAGAYQSVGDAAVLLFQTAAGNIVSLTIPAPGIGIFLPDGITVDPANANIIALVAACIGALTDGGGNAVTTFLGGTYRRGSASALSAP